MSAPPVRIAATAGARSHDADVILKEMIAMQTLSRNLLRSGEPIVRLPLENKPDLDDRDRLAVPQISNVVKPRPNPEEMLDQLRARVLVCPDFSNRKRRKTDRDFAATEGADDEKRKF